MSGQPTPPRGRTSTRRPIVGDQCRSRLLDQRQLGVHVGNRRVVPPTRTIRTCHFARDANVTCGRTEVMRMPSRSYSRFRSALSCGRSFMLELHDRGGRTCQRAARSCRAVLRRWRAYRSTRSRARRRQDDVYVDHLVSPSDTELDSADCGSVGSLSCSPRRLRVPRRAASCDRR